MKKKILSILFAMSGCFAMAQNNPPVVKDIRIGETNLPIVFINTLGHEIDREERVSAYMKIVNNPDGVNYDDTIAHPNQAVDYEGYIGIRYRGNSSFTYSAKKPYSIKLLTDSYENDGEKRKALMHDPSYVSELKARYATYRQGKYADVPAVVDSLATLLTAYGAADRDHEAWPRWGEVIYQNYYLDARSYAEEVAYVKNFAEARIAWLDEQLGYNPSSTASLPYQESGLQAIYSVDGVKRSTLRPGLNIVRLNNGTTKKIWRKW